MHKNRWYKKHINKNTALLQKYYSETLLWNDKISLYYNKEPYYVLVDIDIFEHKNDSLHSFLKMPSNFTKIGDVNLFKSSEKKLMKGTEEDYIFGQTDVDPDSVGGARIALLELRDFQDIPYTKSQPALRVQNESYIEHRNKINLKYIKPTDNVIIRHMVTSRSSPEQNKTQGKIYQWRDAAEAIASNPAFRRKVLALKDGFPLILTKPLYNMLNPTDSGKINHLTKIKDRDNINVVSDIIYYRLEECLKELEIFNDEEGKGKDWVNISSDKLNLLGFTDDIIEKHLNPKNVIPSTFTGPWMPTKLGIKQNPANNRYANSWKVDLPEISKNDTIIKDFITQLKDYFEKYKERYELSKMPVSYFYNSNAQRSILKSIKEEINENIDKIKKRGPPKIVPDGELPFIPSIMIV